ncbi:MAG: type-F conjugative transfer system pilin assembly protein TrbC [Rubrivivax sp.]|nr:type-F conjugative transfer system pilin assembly protein TrbC [Rubrivivax sp.]
MAATTIAPPGKTRAVAAAGAAVAALLAAGPPAWSQTATPRPATAPARPAASMPAAADLDAARQLLPSREEIQRAAAQQRSAAPGQGMPGAAPVVGPVVPPESMDARRAAGAIDLSTLARQYERLRLGPNAGSGDTDSDGSRGRDARGLVAFVSLAMPAASLDRLIADAQRLRAPLMLRGITEGSIRATAARIERLNAGRQVAWQIDPAMFKRFDVRVVPAFVLVDPARPVTVNCPGVPSGAAPMPAGVAGLPIAPSVADAACRPGAGVQTQAFSKVTGDVSFGHALAEIERADPPFSELARRYAARLKVSGGAR